MKYKKQKLMLFILLSFLIISYIFTNIFNYDYFSTIKPSLISTKPPEMNNDSIIKPSLISTKPPEMKNSSTKKPSLTPKKPPEMKNSSCIHHKYHYNNYYNADSYYWICKNDFNKAANDIVYYSYYTSNQDIKLVDNSKCIKNNANYYFYNITSDEDCKKINDDIKEFQEHLENGCKNLNDYDLLPDKPELIRRLYDKNLISKLNKDKIRKLVLKESDIKYWEEDTYLHLVLPDQYYCKDKKVVKKDDVFHVTKNEDRAQMGVCIHKNQCKPIYSGITGDVLSGLHEFECEWNKCITKGMKGVIIESIIVSLKKSMD